MLLQAAIMEVTYTIRHRFRNGQCSVNGKTLRTVKTGGKAIVAGISGHGALRKRLMEMGITKGTEITVKKIAPLGDPIQITVRGYELSLRKDEAENVIIC